jgi:hypothetical protein
MKLIPLFLLSFFSLLAGCRSQAQTHYRVTLTSDQPWSIGEAKPCSFDGKYMEMHCFPPTKDALLASKHYYLVTANFDRPVDFDAQHWAGGSTYPYNIVCRLDSVDHATCRYLPPQKD